MFATDFVLGKNLTVEISKDDFILRNIICNGEIVIRNVDVGQCCDMVWCLEHIGNNYLSWLKDNRSKYETKPRSKSN